MHERAHTHTQRDTRAQVDYMTCPGKAPQKGPTNQGRLFHIGFITPLFLLLFCHFIILLTTFLFSSPSCSLSFFSRDVIFIISLHFSSLYKFLEVLGDSSEGMIWKNVRIKVSKIVEIYNRIKQGYKQS